LREKSACFKFQKKDVYAFCMEEPEPLSETKEWKNGRTCTELSEVMGEDDPSILPSFLPSELSTIF